MKWERRFYLEDEAATASLGARLAAGLREGDVLALSGDLGAGKTALARALIRAASNEEDAEVPSPTFTLVQTYECRNFEIWHFDLYRLAKPDDALELGIDEAFADAVSLIEWPERLGRYLPRQRLDILISLGAKESAREALLTAHDDDWRERLKIV
jgi:tRNA threonylcarbamoyladenosine biosynthesis protein TsaE